MISPVIRLSCFWVWNLRPLVPVLWLTVFGVINLLGWIDGWHHIGQEAALAHTRLVDKNLVAVVRVEH